MRKKLGLVGAVAVSAALALGGCASSGSGGSSESTGSQSADGEAEVNEDGTVNNPEAVETDPNKLVFWSLFAGGDGEYMDEIISDYNGTDPSQQVQSVMLVWADYYTKLTTAVATGNGPDIGVSHISKLPELVDKGVVQPIDDYAEAAGIDWSQYPDSSLEGITFDGEHYALPLDTHAEIMYVNKDFMEEAGIPLNEDGELEVANADDLTKALATLRDTVGDGNTALSLAQQGDDAYRAWWATYFQMGGVPMVSGDGESITMDVDTATKAAEFINSLYREGYIVPGIDDHQKMFQEGHAAVLFGGTWLPGAFGETEGLNFTPQLFPSLFGDNDAAWADSHVMIIPTNSKRTDEETQSSVDFINYVTTTGGLTWAESGQIPANSAVTDDPAYLELPFRANYVKEKDLAVLPPKTPYFGGLKEVMIRNLDTIWNEQAAPDEAIKNMFSEMEGELG